MSYIPSQATEAAELETDQSTTSTTFVDLLSKTINTGSGYLVVTASVAWNALIVAGAFRVVADGEPCAGIDAAVGNGSGAIACRPQVSSGAHTVKLQWRTETLGTLRVRPVTAPDTEHASLVMVEARG